MAAVTICSDFGAQKNKVCYCFHCFPIYFPWSDGTRCHDLHFLNVEFKSTFSLSSFTFIKKLFSSSLSDIRVVSSAYLRLLMFLLAILIPAYASSSPAFLMMYSVYKLNYQNGNTQPWRTFFSQLGTSLLFLVQFYLLLPDLHTDFSRGKSGCLLFPSLQNFSVYCHPQSQRVWHSQESGNRCFPELSCWCFDS